MSRTAKEFSKSIAARAAERPGSRKILDKLDSVRLGTWYAATPKGRAARRGLRDFRDRHADELGVVIGNGPSLSATNLDLLEKVPTFGLNRIFLMSEKGGFSPSYYVCVNRLVIEQSATAIASLKMPQFISWDNARGFHGALGDPIWLRSRLAWTSPYFGRNPPLGGVWEGATVTYVALQLAFFMGFREILLVGVDHSFKTEGPPNQEVTSTGPDQDHFDPAYFGEGFRWQLPDLAVSTIAYRLAREQFERSGRRVLDGTVGGKLEVFPKVDHESYLSNWGTR